MEKETQALEYAVLILAQAIEDGRIDGVLSDVQRLIGYVQMTASKE